jgi:hypothetical protein
LLLDLLADAREVARPAAEAPSDRSQASFTAATSRPFPKSGAPFIYWTPLAACPQPAHRADPGDPDGGPGRAERCDATAGAAPGPPRWRRSPGCSAAEPSPACRPRGRRQPQPRARPERIAAARNPRHERHLPAGPSARTARLHHRHPRYDERTGLSRRADRPRGRIHGRRCHLPDTGCDVDGDAQRCPGPSRDRRRCSRPCPRPGQSPRARAVGSARAARGPFPVGRKPRAGS